MQIKGEFKLNEACGESFLIPMGEENIDFYKLIGLNESSLLLWQRMTKGKFDIDDLVNTILEEYDIDKETAKEDIEQIVKKFIDEGVIVMDDDDEEISIREEKKEIVINLA